MTFQLVLGTLFFLLAVFFIFKFDKKSDESTTKSTTTSYKTRMERRRRL